MRRGDGRPRNGSSGLSGRAHRRPPLKRVAFVLVALVLAALVYGFLTMGDPPPRHPVPEGSPAYVGDVEAPEVVPATP